jgi:hypothetical protein
MRFGTISAILAAAIALPITTQSTWAAEMVPFNGILAEPGAIIPGFGQVMTPYSSIEQPGDIGVRAHTHYHIIRTFVPYTPPSLRPAGATRLLTEPETPASLACVYGLVPKTNGCDPNKVTKVAGGGSKAIGIVDAFHNKTALKDLKTFSKAAGLPAPKLQVVYCSSTECGVSTPPAEDQGWAGEIALDIQWAHAMAPKAKIILVEAASSSFVDLLRAEDKAAELVAAAGGGQVSNSFGGSEFVGQDGFDSHFVHPGVVFFASTGDHKGGTNNPDVNFPSTSPFVVAVGGTTVIRTAAGAYQKQSAWIDTGGGLSAIYPRPSFQNGVAAQVRNTRGVPDVSWNADPNSGAVVYCSAGTCGSSGGFFVFGGTSLASPAIAGMVNNAGKFRNSTAAEQAALYAGLGGAKFTDVKSGKCGNGPKGKFVRAVSGWDRCTGIGAPKNRAGL